MLAGQLFAANPEIAKATVAGQNFLKTKQQDDGSWTSKQSLGISALITYSLLRSGLSADDPSVAKALKYLEAQIRPDGGIHGQKSDHKNYETSLCLLALEAANKDGRYAKTIAQAKEFLVKLQWDEGEKVTKADIQFGGAGYGRTGNRPDLSNTAFLLDALKAAGVKSDDPAMQNALVFVSRCQNLESQANTTPFAAKINDGGFYYTPCAGGQSVAGKDANGGLRSYGSMTYAGLKSMIYAGVGPEDPRVKAAMTWIQKHYTVEENPGLGQMGKYYYLHTFAKTLAAIGKPEIVDAEGKSHNWRTDLSTHILKLQKPDGSWINTAERFMESDPSLATAYGLLCLSYCE